MSDSIILKSFLNKKKEAGLIFSLFSFVYFLLNYPYLTENPLGLHFIRQTDSLSFILYYLHKNNFNFFDVGNLNLEFTNGKTACEFPLIYYVNFIIFKFFGTNFAIVRWLSLILSSISIFLLLKGTFSVLKNIYLSLVVVALVISSSVYRYYSVNFLPDSFALSFVFIGLYFFFKFNNEKKNNAYYLMFFFLSLGALVKIYYGIYLLSVCVYLVIVNKQLIKKTIITSLLSFSLIISWYAFSILYNRINHSNYYLTESAPFWKLSSEDIEVTFSFIFNYWYTKYYLPTIFHVFMAFCLAIFFKMRSPLGNYKTLILTAFLGSLTYSALFFRNFKDHDYYFLTFIPFFYLITVFGTQKIYTLNENKIYRIVVTLIIGIIAILGFNYTSLNMGRRFSNSIDKFSLVGYQLKNISSFEVQNDIPFNAKFIVVGDKTKNGSLVFLNRFGWIYTNYEDNLVNITNKLELADYLLVLSPSLNKTPEEIKTYLSTKKVLKYNNNLIYSLKIN